MTPSQTHKVRKLPRGIFITIFLLIGIIGLIFMAYNQLRLAQENFGLSDPRLSLFQTVRYAWKLNHESIQLTSSLTDFAEEKKFTIQIAESVDSICGRLEVEKIVHSGESVCDYLIYSGKDRQIQAGTFTLEPNQVSLQIANRIADPRAKDILLTIFEGWRIEEIAASLKNLGFISFSSAEFVQFAYHPDDEILATLGLPPGTSLEGFLYPGTYSLKPEISLKELISVLLNEFFSNATQKELVDGFSAQGLNFYQGLTLASIIQRETQASTEMPRIASVFYNRLKADMRLETDPTVQYALGYDPAGQTWWKQSLTISDLATSSPYNTYQNSGLPPGPISNPGLEAIRAAAFPESTPYFYFRVNCDGSLTHIFAITYEEHLANGCD